MNNIITAQRAFFNSNASKSISFRKAQLKKLRTIIQAYEAEMYAAIMADFSKSAFDTYATEIALLYVEIDDALRHLNAWAKPKRVRTNVLNFPAKSYIVPEPLGVCLVIGAWNYPIQLSLSPAIAAIAAGNTVVLKPSELPAKTSAVLAQMVNGNFAPEFFTVVEGGVDITQQLLAERFDKIFFTGSVNVGRIVYQAAARHLTPVTLELGGKSPAFVMADADIKMTARRLVWAKYLNAGQTCIAPDYVLVEKSIAPKLLEACIREIEKENFSIANGNYVQIINQKNTQRLAALIDPEKLLYGGQVDVEQRYIAPTIMHNVSFDDAVMQDEIFGPILPVISFDKLSDAIAHVKAGEKPLSCYIFSSNTSTSQKLIRELSFGGGGVNETIMHIVNSNLPFGGVGQSGMGAYHGKFGFDTFTHYKSILDKPTWFELNLKFYPHSNFKFKLMKRFFE